MICIHRASAGASRVLTEVQQWGKNRQKSPQSLKVFTVAETDKKDLWPKLLDKVEEISFGATIMSNHLVSNPDYFPLQNQHYQYFVADHVNQAQGTILVTIGAERRSTGDREGYRTGRG